MKSIAVIFVFILWVAFVAASWCEGADVSKLKGKRSQPGVDRDYQMTIINPVDVNRNPVNMSFDWSKARDPFRRVK